MPVRSKAQARFLWARHPEIIQRWLKEYPQDLKKLPEYSKTRKSRCHSKSNHLPLYCRTRLKTGKNKGKICGRKACKIHNKRT